MLIQKGYNKSYLTILPACRVSSLSTYDAILCSAKAEDTLTHSIRGGRTMYGRS